MGVEWKLPGSQVADVGHLVLGKEFLFPVGIPFGLRDDASLARLSRNRMEEEEAQPVIDATASFHGPAGKRDE